MIEGLCEVNIKSRTVYLARQEKKKGIQRQIADISRDLHRPRGYHRSGIAVRLRQHMLVKREAVKFVINAFGEAEVGG